MACGRRKDLQHPPVPPPPTLETPQARVFVFLIMRMRAHFNSLQALIDANAVGR
jgi:hypothetical protein